MQDILGLIELPEVGKRELLTKVLFNGKVLESPFVPVGDILQGGVLEFRSS